MTHHDFEHRVTYSETDRMGFAYYANYLVWFEIGRTELIRAAGLVYKDLEDIGYMLPVIEASCRFIRQVHYDDLLTIRTRVSEFRGVRLGFSYKIIKDGQVMAEGDTMHAFMDKDGRPKKLTREILDRLQKVFKA